MESIHNIKQKFNIIGNDYALNKALEKAIQVAPTDISVLILGESGVGKEFIPKIIHSFSHRKHCSYITVNCGAIPEGTIDSELFGHEKGSFTGATNMRKGYFEVANGGTIFLDEVGELPLTTQVRLLRIIESGEFIKVGSSQGQKTNFRIVSATNLNMVDSIQKGKFREDLYYRLNTVQIIVPPLRCRKGDIQLLLKKFSNDFSEKYQMPPIKLTEESIKYLENYSWPGNIRQLKNLIEQISVVEKKREISVEKLKEYFPGNIPSLSFHHSTTINNEYSFKNFSSEKDLIYKVLFDMQKNFNDLKILTLQLIKNNNSNFIENNQQLMEKVFGKMIHHSDDSLFLEDSSKLSAHNHHNNNNNDLDFEEIEEDDHNTSKNKKNSNFSLQKKEIEFIQKALIKNSGKRKMTAKELGISERTLYRKIKQYGL